METKNLINRKLKSIYFQWAINYEGPPPRSFANNFHEHLEFEYYDFNENWLEMILKECDIQNQNEFEKQVILIEKEYEKYSDQQEAKKNRKIKKAFSKFFLHCHKEGVMPF